MPQNKLRAPDDKMYQILNYDGKLLAKTSNISYPYTCFYYMD